MGKTAWVNVVVDHHMYLVKCISHAIPDDV